MGDVTTAFVKQYQDNIRLLTQQKGSKLRGSVMVDTNFVGEFKFYEQLGSDTMQERVSRHEDTPINNPDHQRRRITKRDFVHNKLLDQEDQLNMIVDPKSKYSLSAAHAAGRQIDDRIIDAYNATAFSGKEGSTSESFDSDNQIAAGGTGLTKTKILQAKQLLDDNDVEDEDRFLVIAPRQLRDLLNTTEVTSDDFNTVKALVQGDLKTWIGFTVITSTRLQIDGASARLVYAYHKAAIQLAIQKEPTARIDQRPDKNYAWQVYLAMSIGTTRLEEERIVEIACVEA